MGGNVAHYKAVATEVIAASPDVIAAMTNPFLAQLQPLTKTIPIVFVQVSGGCCFAAARADMRMSPAEFGAYMIADLKKWERVVKESGIKPE